MSTYGYLSTEKTVGLITGLAAGDALGWPQEDRSQIVGGAKARKVPAQPRFRAWMRNAGSQYGRYVEPVDPGDYSDDTQLTLSVARACLSADWYAWLTAIELPVWPAYQRGGGGAVLAAARAWGDGRPPWNPATSRDQSKVARYYEAGANGVAMRIAPHAVITAFETEESLLKRVIRDGLTTHGHPRALVGACIQALGIRHALLREGTLGYGELVDVIGQSESWRDATLFLECLEPSWRIGHERFTTGETRVHPGELWERTCDEVLSLLATAHDGLSKGATANDHQTLEALGVFEKASRGSGTVSAVAALYVATRTAARPMGGLLRTAFLADADTDTLCSMTGAILGALHGPGWLGGLLDEVQDRDYLVDTAFRLRESAAGEDLARYVYEPDRPATTAAVRRWVKAVFDGEGVGRTPDGRPYETLAIGELETRTQQFAARAVLRAQDGQTLVLDRLTRTPPPSILSTVSGRTASTPTRNDSESPSLPEEVPVAARAPEVVAVELRVRDLAESSDFFEKVLGFPCDRSHPGRTNVGSLLVLTSARGTDDEPSSLTTIVTVRSGRAEQIAARASNFKGARIEWSNDRAALWLKEPGNHIIRVLPSPATDATSSRLGGVPATHAAGQDSSTPVPSPAEARYMQEALFTDDA